MREEIEKHLGTVLHSTAKTISERVGLPQQDIALELNRMTRDGLLEREKRGNEYVYWLSRAEPAATPTRAEVTTTPVAECIDMKEGAYPVPTALDAAPTVHGLQPAAQQSDVDATDDRLSDRIRELFEVLGLPPTMTEAIEAARGMRAIALKTAEDRDQLVTERDNLAAANARLRENNAALEKRIDDLTIVDAEFKPHHVYVTLGREAKPRRHATLDKAQRRAAALIRREKESEVLVLEPIGRMVRGSQWVSR